jgi:hypothetical protein
MNLGSTASSRVRRALDRLSRDRWLSGQEVCSIGLRLSHCASGNPTWTYRNARAGECEVIGMLQGRPPVWRDHPRYGEFVDALKDAPPGEKTERLILKLALKGTR